MHQKFLNIFFYFMFVRIIIQHEDCIMVRINSKVFNGTTRGFHSKQEKVSAYRIENINN